MRRDFWFAWFDFAHARGWISTEGTFRDYLVAFVPIWILVAAFFWIGRLIGV